MIFCGINKGTLETSDREIFARFIVLTVSETFHTGLKLMKKSLIRPVVDLESDVERIATFKRLFLRISRVLEQMIAATEADNEYPPKLLVTKLVELQSVHFAVLKAQEAFLEKSTHTTETPEKDHDKIRSAIGSKLDRIRSALAAEEVSEKPG